jgi:hypothetical protein
MPNINAGNMQVNDLFSAFSHFAYNLKGGIYGSDEPIIYWNNFAWFGTR